jgi:hypothetical protein
MPQRVFFSWQADTPTNVGRNFLRGVLDRICKELVTDTTVDDALREVEVDSDTQGVAGQPPIAETIFKKIDDAAVVVADMTFTGTRLDGRPTPNPNVLIEYGWALKSLGNSRVVTVMNSFYGIPNRENLPFDLAHLRWPMTYGLGPETEPATKAEEKRKFTEDLKRAVQASLAQVPTPPVPQSPRFEEMSPSDGPARFRAAAEALGVDEDLGLEVFLQPGPAMWLRIVPIAAPQNRWTTSELLLKGQEENSVLFPLRRRAGDYSYVRARDGHGIYYVPAGADRSSKRILTDTIAFAFRTGELWAVDVGFLALDTDRLYYSDIEETFVKAAENYRRYLALLGVEAPYKWNAGLVGVRGRRLGFPPRAGHVWGPYGGPTCAADTVELSGTIGDQQTGLEALLPFFEHIFEECGIRRPDYLPTK